MRFVPTKCLRTGMLLGGTLYNSCGDAMLNHGEVLTEKYIRSIKKHRYNGVYIEDDVSKDINILSAVRDNVRIKTIKGIKDLFVSIEESNPLTESFFNDTKSQVEVLVDEIFTNKELIVNIADLKRFDDYTYSHSVNVAVISIAIGVALGLSKTDLCQLGYGAILHDIGKIFINKEILNKPDKLTVTEFQEIKKHTLLGCEYINSTLALPRASYLAIRDHHEKYMGGGYPNNLRYEDISLFGRVIALADVYDALTSSRPYKNAVLPSEAMEYIMASTMTLFDPELVNVFTKKIAPYPVGTCVKLSNDKIGIVAENYENYCLRPKIRVFNEKGVDIEPYEIDLIDKKALNITVVGII